MPNYAFKVSGVGFKEVIVKLPNDDRSRFVKVPGREIRAVTAENGALTEFHLGDKEVSIITRENVRFVASLFVESTKDEISIRVTGPVGTEVTTQGDSKTTTTNTETPFDIDLGQPI